MIDDVSLGGSTWLDVSIPDAVSSVTFKDVSEKVSALGSGGGPLLEAASSSAPGPRMARVPRTGWVRRALLSSGSAAIASGAVAAATGGVAAREAAAAAASGASVRS